MRLAAIKSWPFEPLLVSPIMFEPWIGTNYGQQTPRTLILGESHYGDAHVKWSYELEKKTKLCIQQQIDNTWRSRFFTKVASTMIGHLPTLGEKKTFWNSVAYHNLITEPLTASRVGPTDLQWTSSVATLPTVMDDLAPEYCICLGYRMWGVLKHRIEHTPIDVPTDIGPCGAFWSEQLHCTFHGMMHPSGRGFRRTDWHTYIMNLRQARWGEDISNIQK
jgi:hypothetical protein